MENPLFMPIIIGLVALFFAYALSSSIGRASAGNERMQEIAGYIHDGSMAFLRREYQYLALFITVTAIIISIFLSINTAICFILGALLPLAAGYCGMKVATKANVRTAEAARSGMSEALKIAFSGGAVMGLCVVGFGIVGIAVVCYLFNFDIPTITGFALGTSSASLFARVGGGIYTKAADVGADLVGKVEAGIPEDDPRNPAVIADNVGDNVGDVAGMGADLFESYVCSSISAITLGVVVYKGGEGIMFTFALLVAGIVASIIGIVVSRSSRNNNPQSVLDLGTYIAGVLTMAAAAYLSNMFFGDLKAFFAITAGLLVGLAIGKITEVYTSSEYSSVKKISEQSQTGAATTIISGLAVGMYSTFWPVICIGLGIIVSFFVMDGAQDSSKGLFGIALAAVGMVSTLGVTVAVDAYGPISDNAGGIAEMSELPPEVREVTDKLDAVGNTTAAVGKGFSIASATLAALALFSSYAEVSQLQSIDLLNPMTLVGMFLGATLPFVFAAMTMESVGKAANEMIKEVRRQFKEIPGLLEGKGKADYSKCVEISTAAALNEMILPGLMAIAAPLIVGLAFGPETLGGMIGGALAAGVLLAIMMANAGGAWDNAKKYIETGVYGGKGSEPHKASVVGDTVGDPFKDTSGPSLNILFKLMTIVSLVAAPLILQYGGIITKMILK